MANITRIGQLGSTGVSSGPHLHAYVRNLETNQYEDPGIHRSKFLNVRVGPNRVPKYIDDGKGGLILNPAAGLTMTSGWGPRNTGIPDASTDHRGRDYAGKEGTDIFVEGNVKFIPRPDQGGLGNVAAWLTPDQKYELGYGHMKSLGEASDLTNTTTAQAPAEAKGNQFETLLTGLLLGMRAGGRETRQESFETKLQRDLVNQLFQPSQEQNFLNSFIASSLQSNPFTVPNILG
jgi:hypothetical protein